MPIRPSQRPFRGAPSTPTSSHRVARRLNFVRTPSAEPDTIERELLAFDSDEDLAAIIPMPKTIAAQVRAAITQALADRFEYVEELDAWLSSPSEALEGETPFDCVIRGDGLAVLRALDAVVPFDAAPEQTRAPAIPRPSLGLVR